MNATENNERNTETEGARDIVLRIPMLASERARFDSYMDAGPFIRGRWVRDAIMEKLAREKAPVER
jgi:hypothetical protein